MIKLLKLPYCDECKYWKSKTTSILDGKLRTVGTEIECEDYHKCQELAKKIRKGLENND